MEILIVIMAIATFVDIRKYKIPNVCILTGMVLGLYMTYVSYSLGGIIEAFIQMLVVFLAFYPFYLMRGLGAGDIKLLMMTGCYMQEEKFLKYVLVTFILAAIISIARMVLVKECRERLFYLGRYIRKVALTGAVDEYDINMQEKKTLIRLSVPAFTSLIMMVAGIY